MTHEKMIVVQSLDGAKVAISRGVVALAVPAIDSEKKVAIVGAYVLLPITNAVQESLEDVCRQFGLVRFDGVDGNPFAVAPGAVVRITSDPQLLGTSVLELRIPGVVPKVSVRGSVAEVSALLNGEEPPTEALVLVP